MKCSRRSVLSCRKCFWDLHGPGGYVPEEFQAVGDAFGIYEGLAVLYWRCSVLTKVVNGVVSDSSQHIHLMTNVSNFLSFSSLALTVSSS